MSTRREFGKSLLAAPLAWAVSDLRAERAKYRKDLFDDYLPFHEKFVIDREYGGFHCTVRPDGRLVSGEKNAWYEGRGIWVYSYLYNHFGGELKWLETARRSVALIERNRPEGGARSWVRTMRRDGTPVGDPDPEVYSDLFIAEGFAEYGKATGEQRYWDEARAIVLRAVRRFEQPDYYPAIGKTYLGADAKPFPGARVLGVWMVLIRTTTQMLATRADAQLQEVSDRAIDAILNHHYNPRFQLLNELINHDFSRPTDEYEQLVYAGHAIETLWMVMDEAVRRRDDALFDRAAAMFRRHCEVAKDRVYGGLFRNLTHVDENRWTMDKTLFPHQEALIGALLMIEQTGDSWAKEFYAELDAYTRAKFPMRSLGSPLWQVTGNRQVDPMPGMTRAENYHHPRYLMLNLQAVERLTGRKGQPARLKQRR